MARSQDDDAGATAVAEFEANVAAAAGEVPPAEAQAQLAAKAATPAPPAAPVVPAVAATPTEPAVDLAVVPYPKGARLPAHLAKFAGKSLDEIGQIIHGTEQWGHSKSQEASALAREKTLLEARLAAADQVSKMLPAQPAAPPERLADQVARREGFTSAEEGYWKDPVGFTEKVAEAREEARLEKLRAMIAAETGKVKQEIGATTAAERQNAQEANQYINAWETAKAQIRAAGHDITDERWVEFLQNYIQPAIDREALADPNVRFNPARYVQHFSFFYGPAKAVLPTESATSAGAAPSAPKIGDKTIPTLSREERDRRQGIADTFVSEGHMTPEQAQAYIAGA